MLKNVKKCWGQSLPYQKGKLKNPRRNVFVPICWFDAASHVFIRHVHPFYLKPMFLFLDIFLQNFIQCTHLLARCITCFDPINPPSDNVPENLWQPLCILWKRETYLYLYTEDWLDLLRSWSKNFNRIAAGLKTYCKENANRIRRIWVVRYAK